MILHLISSLYVCHLVLLFQCKSDLFYSIGLLVYSIIICVRSELSSRLGVTFNLFALSPFITAKSSKSGISFRSVSQCVGLPVDNMLRLLVLMYSSSILSRGVLILQSHSVCFAVNSPAAMYLSPKY